jgi:hypothetical protein
MQPAKNLHKFSVLPYVPRRFWFGTFFLFVAFLGVITTTAWLILLGLLLSVVCLTTFYKVDIHVAERWYREYIWVLGIKSGSRISYQTIDYLFINKGRITETTRSHIQSTTISHEEYRGFIKFDGQEKIHLLTHHNHAILIRNMIETGRQLHAPLIDYSSGQHVHLL